ncbi:MAG TPA: helix-turn-helix domain-containing protein [Paenalcaligenes sp.]|nr:helix-turn-helix domain-containing protein [Paenalcaligenes sp.]
MSRSHRKLELPDPSIKDHTRDLGVRSVKSAQRVLELFEIFEQLEEPISLADLVRISEIPQSSAWMLVQTLLRMGYICQNPVDKTFMPSLRLNMLGGWVHDSLLPRSNLRLAMRALCEELKLTIVLGQRTGHHVQYAHVMYGTRDRKDQVPIGVVRPLIGTGLGYAILTQLPEDEICALAAYCLAEDKENIPVQTLREVLNIVADARNRGFVYSHRLQNVDRASFSFALTNAEVGSHAGLMALAIAGNLQDVEQRLDDIPAVVNDVAAEFLPDISINISPTASFLPI